MFMFIQRFIGSLKILREEIMDLRLGVEIMSCLFEAAILYILILEYNYDKHLNDHVKRMKKRTKRNYDFEQLTKGEMR
jgi:hypothetical protein